MIQVYAIDASTPPDRQVWHLLGFRRVDAASGASAAVVVDCDLGAISHRDPSTHRWSIAGGHWQLIAAQHAHDPAATGPVGLPPRS